MENDPSQQSQSQQTTVEPTVSGQATPPIAPVVTPPQPSNSTQPPDTIQPAPEKKPIHYIMAAFGILILLSLFLPKSTISQAIVWPIVLFGLVAGISFLIKSYRAGQRGSPIVKVFSIVGGLGVGVVIFIACVIWGLVAAASKNPNPPPPS